ncbi:MAG: response regulator [Gammaproteobacteria bacterium]|nr:response regulator [Gammaproteobacteria bacterium]MBU1442282.1 response regulator [Gammaproteobacteria bacterium]MBU2286721.1 response regulator [Gammaproteobacteria bacterium]MBU2408438.1 response regulator [Gammaproteobacteria bacterium]
MQNVFAMQSSSPPQATVLIVEDDENIVFLVRSFLEGANYRVLHARDGQAAKEFIQSNLPPELVLLDVMLPFVDGFELIRMIREDARWQSTPVLMLTSKTGDEDFERAMQSGANGYIQKPFEPNRLMDRVRQFARKPAGG